jgi:hypothetical protein
MDMVTSSVVFVDSAPLLDVLVSFCYLGPVTDSLGTDESQSVATLHATHGQ